MNNEVSFPALENGLDFIESGLRYIQHEPQARDLKYAALHLNAGIELILKDRLSREHWSLVFANIEKAEQSSYNSGDFVSVDLGTCLNRLNQLCLLKIDQKGSKALHALKKLRNRFEHFEVYTTFEAVTSLAANALSYLLDFIDKEYPYDEMDKSQQELLDSIRKLLPTFYDFVTKRMDGLDPRLDELQKDYSVLSCPVCVQEALVIEEKVHCYFCGYQRDPETAANDYTFSKFGVDWKYIADGGRDPIYSCFECGAQTLVDIGSHSLDMNTYRFVCFSCSQNWGWEEIMFCDRCREPFAKRHKDAIPICDSCFRQALS